MNHFKGFAVPLLLVIIAVLLLGGGAYMWMKTNADSKYSGFWNFLANEQVTSTADSNLEAVDWKTYRNEQYGFEIRYPDFMTIRDCYGTGLFCISASQATDSISYEIVVTDRPSVNLPGSYGGRFFFAPTSTRQPYSSQTVTVSGISFTKELWLDYGGMGGGDKIWNLYTIKNGKFYTISMDRAHGVGASGEGMSLAEQAKYGEGDYYEQVFDQILSTFRFTK